MGTMSDNRIPKVTCSWLWMIHRIHLLATLHQQPQHFPTTIQARLM